MKVFFRGLAQEDVAIATANKKRNSFVAQTEQVKAQELVRSVGKLEKA
ncbi:MAG: hypothetical protein RMX96_10265 [Nostoc sp. ChiSLP02]|nr:hypothetical protein [Nostoc sp. DedSLP05]MDZ8101347.1 hypothetical protein [Nostoc sp. DedSLP01]MDZ8185223.1 hypothetical protein [Nostoc sp. ChiSLP02]